MIAKSRGSGWFSAQRPGSAGIPDPGPVQQRVSRQAVSEFCNAIRYWGELGQASTDLQMPST